MNEELSERLAALEIAFGALARSARDKGIEIGPTLRQLADDLGVAAVTSSDDAKTLRGMAISGHLQQLADDASG